MDADNDLLIVRELRKMSSLSKRGEKMAPRASEEDLKWLNWPDFVQVWGSVAVRGSVSAEVLDHPLRRGQGHVFHV